MAEEKTKLRVYIFDASVLLRLNRINETDFEIPQTVWDRLSDMLHNGEIISHHFVYEEVVSDSEKPDKVSEWFRPHKKSCFLENEQQVLFNQEVVREYPGLIDAKREKEQADPWLIAMARDLNIKNPEHEYVIVTQESTRSTVKIPAAAANWNIKTMTLKEFLQEKGISLIVASTTE